MQEEMAQVREQLLGAPASVVLANHAMGMYELAAIHLTATEPKLTEAVLAIDALNALVTSLEGRRSEEHTSELQSLMSISYAVFCLKKKKTDKTEIIVYVIAIINKTKNIQK